MQNQIGIQSGGNGVVKARRLIHIQMMTDGILQTRIRSVMKECRLQRGVSQRRTAKLVTVGRIPCYLFQTKVLILSGSVEYHIAFAFTECRGDLRYANHVHSEIAEHLVGLSCHCVTLDAAPFAEKNQCSLLFRNAHRLCFAPSETVDRSVGEDESKFKLRNCPAKHRKVNRASSGNRRKHRPKEFSISRGRIQSLQNGLADGFISETVCIRKRQSRAQPVIKLIKLRPNGSFRPGKSGNFDQLCWRNVRLGNQQMSDDWIVWRKPRRALG